MQTRRATARTAILAVLATVTAACVLAPIPSRAHSWYPPDCCNENDCKKVDGIETLSDGSQLFHFRGQQVIVPRGFPQMPSQDLHVHVCVYRTITGRWAPRCVFMPGTA
jgi:hypothetical protein